MESHPVITQCQSCTLLQANCEVDLKQNGGETESCKKLYKWKEDLTCLCVGNKKKLKQNKQDIDEKAKEKKLTPISEGETETEKTTRPKGNDVTIPRNKIAPLKKSYTLPNRLDGTNSLTRNQKHLFRGKMDVLGEDAAPPIVLGESPADVKTLGNDRPPPKRVSLKQDPPAPQLGNGQAISPRYLVSVCPNHDGKNGTESLEAVLYCGLCSQPVCYKCAFEKHKDHSVSPVPVAAENIRINLTERKRKIENTISQMRTKRKSAETSGEEILQRIHAQFEQIVQRLKKKEEEVTSELEKLKQKRINLIYGAQNQQETAWGQIDAVLKTQDDVKMLEEYGGLSLIDFKDDVTASTENPLFCNNGTRPTMDLNAVQDEIEKIRISGAELEIARANEEIHAVDGIAPRATKKRFSFKLDQTTAHSGLRVASNALSMEFVGVERNGVNIRNSNANGNLPNGTNPYQSKHGVQYLNGIGHRLKRAQFATVLGDASITQGKQYWEVSVNRSMEYRLGVSYKQMQGTKSMADEHNCWALCLTYPDRFSATHKHHKEYIFVPTHAAAHTIKVIRIGIFLDYERGVLSFYNASTAAEKRHLYTFRTFFNRPIWPLLSLRQGKLQLITGLPVPRNLVWKTR